MKNLIYFILSLELTGFNSQIFSQTTSDLYLTKEIKQAYDKGTRSYDGNPGQLYFVNETNYKIKAEFNPKTLILEGVETITYVNNSPDTLKNMFFNLYQDIFKKGNMRDWDIGAIDITDGVQIKKIVFNSEVIDVSSDKVSNNSSILSIILPKSIAPHSNAEIIIEWSFKMPAEVPIRMGTYGGDNFMIAYWYPKVAVYDDISGWNIHGHSGNQEFYNDFGDYDVEITVPGEYSIWSTGLLQNENELYTQKYIERIKESKHTDKIIHIISNEDRKNNDILKKADLHVWKFKSENTPDFAFSMSKTYLWDATSYKSGDQLISINAVYKPDSEDFHEVAEISRNSIKFFTEEIPGIPYPYPQLTAFNGDGGMEFPGMVNDGDGENRDATLYVTSHEIAHSYFPFYTGLNEQKYAWMDEGLISFFPQFVIEKYTHNEDYVFFKYNIKSYNRYAGTFNDVPLMVSSDNVGRYAYRFHAYARSSVSFYLLYQYLGKEKFTAGLQLFTHRWNGKHPTPYDFFHTFNEVAGEDLAWFWKPWFFEMGYADLSIGEIEYTDNMKIIVNIMNKTGFPVPVHLKVEYADGSIKEFKQEINIWAKGENKIKIAVQDKGLVKIILDSELTPDAYPDNNIYSVKK